MTYNIYKGNKDWFPPYLSDYTEKDIKRLEWLYNLLYGELCVVDPLGTDQIYAIMLDRIPTLVRIFFFKVKYATFY